jgi:PadR family transcriptional regulator AphA
MAIGIRHFVLGLLANEPMSGYDVKRLFGRFRWLIGSSSFGNIYPALHALLEDGLVSVDVIASPDRPPRKVYSINEKGLDALQEWIEEPPASDASLKAFVMRLLLSSNLSREGLVAHLEQRRAEVALQRDALHDMEAEAGRDDIGNRLALDYGLTMSGREIDWLDETLELLRAPVGEAKPH